MGFFAVLREFFSKKNECLTQSSIGFLIILAVLAGIGLIGLIGWGVDNAFFHLIGPEDMAKPLLYFFVGLMDVCMMLIVVAIPTCLVVGVVWLIMCGIDECKAARRRANGLSNDEETGSLV